MAADRGDRAGSDVVSAPVEETSGRRLADVRKLHHFVVLAETLNYREAATRLCLTQPALTRSIAALERELGARLFLRDSRHVAITARGAALLEHARRVVQQTEDLVAAARSPLPAAPERLRVLLLGDAAELNHRILTTFRERFAQVDLTVEFGDYLRGLEPLMDGEYDVALVRAPTPVAGLRAVELFREGAALLVPEAHALAGRPSVALSEVEGAAAVTFPPRIPAAWGRYWLGGTPEVAPRLRIGAYARGRLEIMTAVAYRDLLSIVPASAARLDIVPGVRGVPIVDLPTAAAALVFPDTSTDAVVESFTRLAAEVSRRHLDLVPGAEPPR